MRIRLVSLEDGITACGFRKIAAHVARLNADTTSHYICTRPYRSVGNILRGTYGGTGELGADDVDEVAHRLADADLLGFSSMTGYADLTRQIAARVKELNPSTYIIWGGIHPIIHPEDAISADVDAICNGEGEFAFNDFFGKFLAGRDHTGVGNFWFRRGEDVIRNSFLPLMTSEQMDELPFPQYGQQEEVYRPGQGFRPTTGADYLENSGLSYSAIWSIGCPFHCSFCGNTKFIENDPKYKKIRHSSANYIVEEIKHVRRQFPFISQVSFYDDSFMAITYRELEDFAEKWKSELGIPFAVYGVIPNYVNRDKFEILTWAGMNRIRMGIQSGSQAILDFYKRPTPPDRIEAAAAIISEFSPKYHVPPAYDIIMDNPIETRQDVVDTLELLYRMPRPYNLFIYSLKVIPNTAMAAEMAERGVDIEEISANYSIIPPRAANLMLYLVAMWRPPRWLFDRLLKRVKASSEPQPVYPTIGILLRTVYLTRNVINYLRYMDFSHIAGRSGWVFWRLGIVGWWQKHVHVGPPRPERKEAKQRIGASESAASPANGAEAANGNGAAAAVNGNGNGNGTSGTAGGCGVTTSTTQVQLLATRPPSRTESVPS